MTFEKLATLRKSAFWQTLKTPLLYFVIATGALIWGGTSLISEAIWRANSLPTIGQVLDVKSVHHAEDDAVFLGPQAMGKFKRPVVRYVTHLNEVVEAKAAFATFYLPVVVGSKVKILYDPKQPKVFKLDHGPFPRMIPLFAVLLGALFTGLAGWRLWDLLRANR